MWQNSTDKKHFRAAYTYLVLASFLFYTHACLISHKLKKKEAFVSFCPLFLSFVLSCRIEECITKGLRNSNLSSVGPTAYLKI